MEKRGLVLEGGGVLGAAQAAIIKQMFEEEYMWESMPCNKWQIVAGTSVGSINGLLIALGYSAREIYNVWSNVKKSDLVKTKWNIFQSFYNRNPMESFIKNLMNQKGADENINFQSLYDLHGVDLICIGTVVQTGRPVLFSKNHNNISVFDAIMMSSAFPIGFLPINIFDSLSGKNIQIIDGGIMMNCPILPVVHLGLKEITVLSVGAIEDNYWIDGTFSSIKRILKLVSLCNEWISLSWAKEYCPNMKIYYAPCKGIDCFDWSKIHIILQEGIQAYKEGIIDPDLLTGQLIDLNQARTKKIFLEKKGSHYAISSRE